jgi:hypothetical protein
MYSADKIVAMLCIVCATVSTARSHDIRGVASEHELVDAHDFNLLVRNRPDDGTRWVLSRTLLWKPGSTLSACFMNGSDATKSKVIEDAKYLVGNASHPVNLKISFGNGVGTTCNNTGEPYKEDVRVSFTDGCCSAYVGRLSHNSSVAKGPNVFLQEGLDDMRIKHELLHALGFQHEHQKPDNPCKFNYAAIEQAYGWSEAMVTNNFNKLDKNSSRLSWSPGFDKDSVMKYYFDPSFLEGGEKSACYDTEAVDLSQQDWQGLQAAYPIDFDVKKFSDAVHSKRTLINLGINPPAALSEALQSLPAD